MKTVPTVRVADTTDAVVLPDLPEEIQLAMGDIAGAAREGLLAMSVATGLAVMQAMFEAEITEIAGPKGKHNPDRAAVRHGSEKGSVTLGGRRVSVTRPWARTVEGHEVPLNSYAHFACEDLLAQVVMERMLAGVATRHHARTAEPVGEAAGKQKSTSKSAVSRRFVKQTETALAELMARDLSGEDIKVLMIDGEHMAERCVVVALAITADGIQLPPPQTVHAVLPHTAYRRRSPPAFGFSRQGLLALGTRPRAAHDLAAQAVAPRIRCGCALWRVPGFDSVALQDQPPVRSGYAVGGAGGVK